MLYIELFAKYRIIYTIELYALYTTIYTIELYTSVHVTMLCIELYTIDMLYIELYTI